MSTGLTGYAQAMLNPRLEDRAMGLELQIEELVEEQRRAAVQHRYGDATRLQREAEALQTELAQVAEAAVTEPVAPAPLGEALN